LITVWWILILAALGVFMLLFAPREERISDADNRMLAGAPEFGADEVISGEFMSGVDSWLSDGFFVRDKVVSFTKTLLAKTALERYDVDVEAQLEKEAADADRKLIEEEENEIPADEPEKETASEYEPLPEAEVIVSAEETSTEKENETEAESEAEPLIVDKKTHLWLETRDGERESVYTFSNENISTVAKMLNAYRDALGEDGTVHYMQIPFSQTAHRWINSTGYYVGWGSNVEDALQKKVKDGVYIHNVPEILSEPIANDEYMYFRLDHHWTPEAASTVVSAIMDSQGYPTVDYDDYTYKVYKNFYGSHYDASDMDRMHRLADTLEIMYPKLPETHYLVTKLTRMKKTEMMGFDRKSYTAYMKGTQGPWRVIETGYSTGRCALVIADSFGTTFTPYLMPYYDTIVMTDLRPDYYDKSEAGASVRKYMQQYGVDDVYMCLSTTSGVNKQYSLNYMMRYLD